MGNRVLLDSKGLKVSAPGQDVLTTNGGGLIFNSDWPALSVAITGTHTVSWGPSGTYTVPFGRTFPTPPPVLYTRIKGSRRQVMGGNSGFTWDRWVWDNDWASRLAVAELTVLTTTTGFTVSRHFSSGNSNVNPPSFVIGYQVLDYNL